MKKTLVMLVLFMTNYSTYAQETAKITTFDFVQILNDNRKEALYYYQHNWRVLRNKAVKKGYIHSFEWFEVERTEDAPFAIILKTTYRNSKQFDKREENFQKLIDTQGSRKLLNDKPPKDFRAILFSKEVSKHLEKR